MKLGIISVRYFNYQKSLYKYFLRFSLLQTMEFICDLYILPIFLPLGEFLFSNLLSWLQKKKIIQVDL